MNNLTKLISALIDTAKVLGLDDASLAAAKDLLDNQEYGLAFDTIITQLYEYEIEIDNEFYLQIEQSAKKMGISEDGYLLMNELIRSEKVIPKPIKDRLADILKNLNTD